MRKTALSMTLIAVALAASACGVISDAPEAGAEKFTPVSNNAYLVRQGPMLDRYWIEGAPTPITEQRMIRTSSPRQKPVHYK